MDRTDGKRSRRFEALTLPHLDAVYRMAYHLSQSADDADELTQETYLRACRGFAGYRGGNVKAWLFAILRHAAVDRVRRRQREPILLALDDVDLLPDHPGEPWSGWSEGPEEGVLADLLGEDVQRALSTLPAEWRFVVLLADVEDFTYREIADTTETPIGTVMSRLHRGRKRLYDSLRGYARAAGYVTEARR